MSQDYIKPLAHPLEKRFAFQTAKYYLKSKDGYAIFERRTCYDSKALVEGLRHLYREMPELKERYGLPVENPQKLFLPDLFSISPDFKAYMEKNVQHIKNSRLATWNKAGDKPNNYVVQYGELPEGVEEIPFNDARYIALTGAAENHILPSELIRRYECADSSPLWIYVYYNECPFCAQLMPTVKTWATSNPDKLARYYCSYDAFAPNLLGSDLSKIFTECVDNSCPILILLHNGNLTAYNAHDIQKGILDIINENPIPEPYVPETEPDLSAVE